VATTRVGSTEKYSKGWDSVFGAARGGKAKGAKAKVAAKKKSAKKRSKK
jgi:hypothetical protein